MTKFIIGIFSKEVPVALRFLAWVIMAFLSGLCFFTIDSVWASHTGNGLWWILGGILGFFTVDIAIGALAENKPDASNPAP